MTPKMIRLKPEVDAALTKLDRGETIDSLLTSGHKLDDVVVAIRHRAELKNRADRASIPSPAKQNTEDWGQRKTWLLDGQPIYGELGEFFWPAVKAAEADDQDTLQRQYDLLFKALRTFLGDNPPPEPEVPEVGEVKDVDALQPEPLPPV